MRPIRLGLEWVRVECGRVIKHIQFVNPFQIPQHEPRPKTFGVPLTQEMVDPFGARLKSLLRLEELSVVTMVMHAHFETVCLQVPD